MGVLLIAVESEGSTKQLCVPQGWGSPSSNAVREGRLLRVGITGTLATALCCFTPLLVGILGVLGFSAAVGWLDYVLLPALAGFAGVTALALYRRQRTH